jgi:hypothetical protein
MRLDTGFTIFGTYFDTASVPFMMFIDARTMEIDRAGVGAIETARCRPRRRRGAAALPCACAP